MNVAVRELEAHLNMYLDRVKAGETLTVTEDGRPVARLAPAVLPAHLEMLLANEQASWSGARLSPVAPISPSSDGKTIAQMVSEDRDRG